MTRLSTLTRLRDMVRNADGPDRELACRLDAALAHYEFVGEISTHCGDAGEDEFTYYVDTEDGARARYLSEIDAADRSLDAVFDLVEAQLPGCKIALADVGPRHTAHIKWGGLEAAAYGNTRPLAILDCLLSVLIEKEERE